MSESRIGATFVMPTGRTPMRVRDLSHVAQDFRTALSKSDHLVSYGKHKEALQVMVESLKIDRIRRRDGHKAWKLRKWADVKDPIEELFRLAFTVRDTSDLFHSMWQNLGMIRENMRGNPNADDIWTNVAKEIRFQLESLLVDAQRRATQELAREDTDVVALVSGRSREKLIKTRFSVEHFAASVMSRCIFARFMGTTASMLRLTLDTVDAFSVIATRFQLPQAATSLVRSFNGYLSTFLFSNLVEYGDETGRQRQNENARMLKESRTVFGQEVNLMERTFEVCAAVQRSTKAMGLWQALSDSIHMTAKILMEFPSEEKPPHWPLIVSTYKALGSIFLECDNRTFHALALGRAAAVQHKIIVASGKKGGAGTVSLASLAVVAALAAPDISERRNQFGANDGDFRRLSEIAEAFRLPFPPSRGTLCADIKFSGAVEDAHPAAHALLVLLTAPVVEIDICAKAQQLLKQLEPVVDIHNFEELFENEVRRLGLSKYFLRLAEQTNSVNIGDVQRTVQFGGAAEEGYDRVMNVLLEDLNIPVLVDQESESVSFTAAGAQRINATMSQLAHAATPARKAVPAKRPPLPPPSFEELELEANRLVAFHSLVRERLAKNNELKNTRAENLRHRQQEKKHVRVEEEMDKQKVQNDANTARMAKEYQQAEVKERRKVLIQRLQEKHKGLKIPPGIVELNQQSFLDNCTAALTAFQRKLETMKRVDVRRMDHFERACREQDIPRRREIGESMASQLETERATRWANFLAQHRKEYDEKVATRERLLKFLPHAAEYMAQLAERSTKTTKRDEQEELLRLEKARLAQAQAEPAPAASRAAAPTAGAPAAAPTAAAAPQTWQRKPRE